MALIDCVVASLKDFLLKNDIHFVINQAGIFPETLNFIKNIKYLLIFLRSDFIKIVTAKQNNLDALSASGIENMGSVRLTKSLSRKWKLIKNPFSLIGFNYYSLKIMFFLMYYNWELFCKNKFDNNKQKIISLS